MPKLAMRLANFVVELLGSNCCSMGTNLEPDQYDVSLHIMPPLRLRSEAFSLASEIYLPSDSHRVKVSVWLASNTNTIHNVLIKLRVEEPFQAVWLAYGATRACELFQDCSRKAFRLESAYIKSEVKSVFVLLELLLHIQEVHATGCLNFALRLRDTNWRARWA